MSVAVWLWLSLALILAIAEGATLSLVLLMVAVGAVGGAFVAMLGGGIALQVVVMICISIAMLAAIRPIAMRHLQRPDPAARMGIGALIGREAVVTAQVTGQDG